MEALKIRHSNNQIAGISFCFLLTLCILSLVFIPISGLVYFIAIIASFLFLFLLLCIDYIVYNIRIENETLIVRHLFFCKSYDLNKIEYIDTSYASSHKLRSINPNIGKNKSSYTVHFKNGKVRFNDTMKNSEKLVQILSKYCIFDRILN